LGGCSDQPETISGIKPKQSIAEPSGTPKPALTEELITPEAIPSELSADKAETLIFELPEIKAWSNYIEQKTQGKVHAAIMVSSKEPQELDGKQYWSVDFYESQQTHVHRWESFLVRIDGKEILVDDLADGPIGLQEWRDQKKPLDRIKS
jgi:hypothetical protein